MNLFALQNLINWKQLGIPSEGAEVNRIGQIDKPIVYEIFLKHKYAEKEPFLSLIVKKNEKI